MPRVGQITLSNNMNAIKECKCQLQKQSNVCTNAIFTVE